MTSIQLDNSKVQKQVDLSQDDKDLIEFDEIDKKFRNKERTFFFYLKNGLICVIVAISLACIITYFWNTLAPYGLRWLLPTEVEQFKDFTISIVSGVLTAVSMKLFVKLG